MKKEILDLGYEVSQVEDGRVTFIGDAEAICRANIFLRTTERVLLKVGSFHAETFEDLFQGTRAIPWEEYLPKDAKFWVAKASSIKSKLFSPSDIQSIMKKAMVERMRKAYGIEWFPENGASFPLRVFLFVHNRYACRAGGFEQTGVLGFLRSKLFLRPVEIVTVDKQFLYSVRHADILFADSTGVLHIFYKQH